MTERIFHELVDAFPKLLLPAIKVTIPLTLLSFSIGLLIALTTALVQVAKVPVLRKAARFYVWIIRCTPLIVQLFVVYFGLPSIGIRLAAFPSAVIGVAVSAREKMNSQLMAEAVANSTLLSMITLPIWIMICSHLYL